MNEDEQNTLDKLKSIAIDCIMKGNSFILFSDAGMVWTEEFEEASDVIRQLQTAFNFSKEVRSEEIRPVLDRNPRRGKDQQATTNEEDGS